MKSPINDESSRDCRRTATSRRQACSALTRSSRPSGDGNRGGDGETSEGIERRVCHLSRGSEAPRASARLWTAVALRRFFLRGRRGSRQRLRPASHPAAAQSGAAAAALHNLAGFCWSKSRSNPVIGWLQPRPCRFPRRLRRRSAPGTFFPAPRPCRFAAAVHRGCRRRRGAPDE